MRALFVFLLMFAVSVSAKAATAISLDTGNQPLSMCDDPQLRAHSMGTTVGYYDMLSAVGAICGASR
jgi:hypothetical protein